MDDKKKTIDDLQQSLDANAARNAAHYPSDLKTVLADDAAAVNGKIEPIDHIMQFFSFEHLPAHMQVVSKPFAALAADLVAQLPRNPERTVALRKLLESKDAAVRAFIAGPAPARTDRIG